MMVCSEQNETPIRLEQIFTNDQTETLADLVFDQSLNQKQRNQLKDIL
jgi:hypothetical protein